MYLKNPKSIGFTILIILQITIVLFLGKLILNKRKTKFIPLNKENYKKTLVSNYKYYYEPIIGGYDEQISWDQEKTIKYTINNDSIRSNKEYLLVKDKNITRIIAIGDSFTFGQLVEDNENYPTQLELKLNNNTKKNKYEVINLGTPGYDTAYAAERYRIRGAKYNPDIIIWFLIEDDFTNICELEIGYARYFKENLTQEERKKYGKIYGEKYLNEAMGSEEVFKTLKTEGILIKSLEEIEKLSSYLGKKLIIITFEQLKGGYKKELFNICKKNKCQVFDKLPNIYKDSRLYLPDNHPTKLGYEKIVDVLYKKILDM